MYIYFNLIIIFIYFFIARIFAICSFAALLPLTKPLPANCFLFSLLVTKWPIPVDCFSKKNDKKPRIIVCKFQTGDHDSEWYDEFVKHNFLFRGYFRKIERDAKKENHKK